jgi:hypothetical protein
MRNSGRGNNDVKKLCIQREEILEATAGIPSF